VDEDSNNESENRDDDFYADTSVSADELDEDLDLTSNAWKGSVLYAAYPDKRQRSSTHIIGKVMLDDEYSTDEFITILCDTGA
jgi:hypothetical protein